MTQRGEGKTVFIITPPENATDYKFLLIVRSGGSPFGGGSRPTVVGVDEIQFKEVGGLSVVFAYDKEDNLRMAFPASRDFTLIDSRTIELTTPEEAAKRQKADEDAINKVLGPPDQPEYTPDRPSMQYL